MTEKFLKAPHFRRLVLVAVFVVATVSAISLITFNKSKEIILSRNEVVLETTKLISSWPLTNENSLPVSILKTVSHSFENLDKSSEFQNDAAVAGWTLLAYSELVYNLNDSRFQEKFDSLVESLIVLHPDAYYASWVGPQVIRALGLSQNKKLAQYLIDHTKYQIQRLESYDSVGPLINEGAMLLSSVMRELDFFINLNFSEIQAIKKSEIDNYELLRIRANTQLSRIKTVIIEINRELPENIPWLMLGLTSIYPKEGVEVNSELLHWCQFDQSKFITKTTITLQDALASVFACIDASTIGREQFIRDQSEIILNRFANFEKRPLCDTNSTLLPITSNSDQCSHSLVYWSDISWTLSLVSMVSSNSRIRLNQKSVS